MKVSREVSLKDFEFWSGAVYNAERLSDEEFDILEEYLEELSAGKAIDETAINDFFWFEDEIISELLGITEEELAEREPLR